MFLSGERFREAGALVNEEIRITHQRGLHPGGHPDLYIPWRDGRKGTYFVGSVDGDSTIVAVRIDIRV
jgi:hypothetical protein